MVVDRLDANAKQFRHLLLAQPKGFVLVHHLDAHTSVGRGVEDHLVIQRSLFLVWLALHKKNLSRTLILPARERKQGGYGENCKLTTVRCKLLYSFCVRCTVRTPLTRRSPSTILFR